MLYQLTNAVMTFIEQFPVGLGDHADLCGDLKAETAGTKWGAAVAARQESCEAAFTLKSG